MNRSYISYIIVGVAVILSVLIISRNKLNNENVLDVSLDIKDSLNSKESINKIQDAPAQIIEVAARGGYSPRYIEAKADTNTVLRVKSAGAFDCSSSLVIPKYDISKLLPATGTTDIELGAHKAGTEIDGMCSMGMYNFTIKFI